MSNFLQTHGLHGFAKSTRSTPGFPVGHQLPELAQISVHRASHAIQSSHPLLSISSHAFNLSCITVFSNKSVLRNRWPKYWSFSFSISPSNEYSGLISFRIAWFDLLVVQWTHKSPLQQHTLKTSILHVPLSLWSNSHLHTWLLEKS